MQPALQMPASNTTKAPADHKEGSFGSSLFFIFTALLLPDFWRHSAVGGGPPFSGAGIFCSLRSLPLRGATPTPRMASYYWVSEGVHPEGVVSSGGGIFRGAGFPASKLTAHGASERERLRRAFLTRRTTPSSVVAAATLRYPFLGRAASACC